MKKVRMYYLNQNNSGGYFIPTEKIYIEGKVYPLSMAEAFEGFYHIGYVNKEDCPQEWIDNNSEFCSCCGERWSQYFVEQNDVYIFESIEDFNKNRNKLKRFDLYTCEYKLYEENKEIE